MIHRRVGADDDDDLGIQRRRKRRRDRAGVQPFHQRRHRRRMAQPRAMIDIVGAEPGANQLLEQIGLLVRAFGRTEPGERLRPPSSRGSAQPRRGEIERLLPGRFAEMRPGIGRIDLIVRILAAPFGSRTSGFVSRCG